MLLGGEQPPQATLGQAEPKEHGNSEQAAQPAPELLVEGGEGAQGEGQEVAQGSGAHEEEDRRGRPVGSSPDLMIESSDVEGGAVGSYTSRTGEWTQRSVRCWWMHK